MADSITLSLISHTNVGKTTLARTLLRRDVGEVLDQAHVTDRNTSYSLIREGESELVLWDTPGFGDSARLLERLRRTEQPVLWFLQQTWDRITDRPFWSSQLAVLNIREEADVVLYLVNASEEPEEAGYVVPELELLGWLGRPILVLLNQAGEGPASPGYLDERTAVWERHVERFSAVKEVLVLDAFSRCWVQEGRLLRTVEAALPEESLDLMKSLRRAWERRNLEIFGKSVKALSHYLAEAAIDREELEGKWSLADSLRKSEKAKAMEQLAKRLESSTEGLMKTLLLLHGLEGKVAEIIDRQVDAVMVAGDLLHPERSAFWGGMVSGALGGLAADAMAGGMTFLGGMVAGALVGAAGGAGLARGYQMVVGDKPSVGWAPEFLDLLLAQAILRYLAVAHFGRGRGEFQQQELSERWHTRVGRGVQRYNEGAHRIWQGAPRDPDARRVRSELSEMLDELLRSLLVEGYPAAEKLLFPEEAAADRPLER